MIPRTVKLSEVCDDDSPITYGILQPGPDLENGVPYVRPSEIKRGKIVLSSIRRTSPEIADRYRKSIIHAGDILITIVGTIGHIAVVPEELHGGNITQSSARVRICPSYADGDFIRNYLRSPFATRQYNRHRLGVAVPRLNLHHVRDLQIPLPPLTEQKRIAGILDAADALRAKRRESLAQLDTLLQSTFLTLFGDPVTNPMGWEVVPLGSHASKIGSGATPTGGKEAYKDHGISLIRSMNVRDNAFLWKDLARIDDVQAARLSNVVVQADDVLLNITGASVARVCRAPSEVLPARVNQHVCIIRPSDSLDPVFLERQLLTPSMKNKLLGIGSVGATRQAINKSEVLQLRVPLPPLDLQRRFAAMVESVERQKARLRAHLTDLDTLFASLQSRAFSGEL